MNPYYSDSSVTLLHGDAAAQLQALPAASVDCIVTSPPCPICCKEESA